MDDNLQVMGGQYIAAGSVVGKLQETRDNTLLLVVAGSVVDSDGELLLVVAKGHTANASRM